MVNSLAYNNTVGFYVGYGSNYNTLLNDTAQDSVGGTIASGFWVDNSSANDLTNCSSYDVRRGFMLTFAAENNTILNSTSYNVSLQAFYIYLANSNTVINSTAYDAFAAASTGFYAYDSNFTNLTWNRAWNVTLGFFVSGVSTYSTLEGNLAFNTSAIGFALENNATYNNLTSNTNRLVRCLRSTLMKHAGALDRSRR